MQTDFRKVRGNVALKVSARVDAVLDALPERDLNRVLKALALLTEFPLMAQTANFADAPDIRRVVAGNYLIYYRYDPLRQVVNVMGVRHGRRKPIESEELEG